MTLNIILFLIGAILGVIMIVLILESERDSMTSVFGIVAIIGLMILTVNLREYTFKEALNHNPYTKVYTVDIINDSTYIIVDSSYVKNKDAKDNKIKIKKIGRFIKY